MIMFLIGLFALPALAGTNGQSDYKAFCAGCHGANANVQKKKDVRKLSLKTSTKSRKEMISIIETGKGNMPSFREQLPRKRIEAIVDYIIALRGSR